MDPHSKFCSPAHRLYRIEDLDHLWCCHIAVVAVVGVWTSCDQEQLNLAVINSAHGRGLNDGALTTRGSCGEESSRGALYASINL